MNSIYITRNEDNEILCVTDNPMTAVQYCIQMGWIDANTEINIRHTHYCHTTVGELYGENWQQQVVEHWNALCDPYTYHYDYYWNISCDSFSIHTQNECGKAARA